MKKFSIFITVILVISLLAACGGQAAPVQTSAPTEAVTPEPTAEPVTPRIGALTGPTAMGMAKLFGDASGDYECTLAGSADELTPLILQGELDIAAVPMNLASVLYNKTEGGVRLLAVNVLGVLYIGEYGSEEINSVLDLNGRTIYATGKGSVPEYFLRYVLAENGIDMDTDLTVEWKSEPAEVVALLNADGSGVAMLPQPYATAAAMQLGDGFRLALSLSDEWAALDNGSLCTTAGIIVRSEFADAHPEAVEKFLADYAASAEWVNANTDEAAALCEELGIVKAAVARIALPKCNIVCVTGADMKSAAGGCLGVLYGYAPASVGGALPGDDFYYGA